MFEHAKVGDFVTMHLRAEDYWEAKSWLSVISKVDSETVTVENVQFLRSDGEGLYCYGYNFITPYESEKKE